MKLNFKNLNKVTVYILYLTCILLCLTLKKEDDFLYLPWVYLYDLLLLFRMSVQWSFAKNFADPHRQFQTVDAPLGKPYTLHQY